MSTRLNVDEYFVQMAKLVARRATCSRRQVGCVLVNSHNHVLSTGYNGVAKGQPHCIDVPCPGANCASGTGLHLCKAIHAEQNALLQCGDVHQIYAAYVTASPCVQCLRLLLNTSCYKIVFAEEYPHPESQNLWEVDGRKWVHHQSVCDCCAGTGKWEGNYYCDCCSGSGVKRQPEKGAI